MCVGDQRARCGQLIDLFEMLVVYRHVDFVEPYQTPHGPNAYSCSKFNPERCREIVEYCFWRPNLQWSVQVLRHFGAEEGYGKLMLSGTIERHSRLTFSQVDDLHAEVVLFHILRQIPSSRTGSASATFVPPLDTIPDLSDFRSMSGSSLSCTPSLISSHHTRATDDNAISNSSYLYPSDPRVITPSRSSSRRRTSSMADLEEEFQTALHRARGAKPGLGFGGLSLVGALTGDASPVTISSGSRLSGDVRVTPPQSPPR